jgi:hypothetical protein
MVMKRPKSYSLSWSKGKDVPQELRDIFLMSLK